MVRPALPPYRILCVEDEAAERTLLATLLSDYELTVATTGFEAMRSINSGVFDLHLVDQWLPDWSGIEFCRQVRRLDPRVPILFLAATEREEDRRRAINAGASCVMLKPIEPEILRQQVRTMLTRSTLENLRAIAEEERLVMEELKRRAAEIMQVAKSARESAEKALQRSTRIKALKAFQEAGGTLGHFERTWPPLYSEAWAKLRVEDERG